MAVKEKIRIRLKSYDHQLVDTAAEKIVETAADSGVPIYEDNSLATMLTQLQLGQEIPEELYKAIVEIYVYFLHFDPETGLSQPEAQRPAEQSEQAPQPERTGEENR